MNTHPTCEILAPAGDRAALEAALSAGAEAVYFGLDEGFNARARAFNFRIDGLAEVVSVVHLAGARAYLALNTLVFQSELAKVEEILVEVARSGIDAIIVQDPAIALLGQAICPELEIHASTQMTISSPEAAKFAETLGVTRVVVPRELSVKEIELFKRGTELELEVFIMGALCVAWSGQCLSSEAWGGRSANRGKCAQACRLPYELVVDGELKPLGDIQYLLSPQDLAGFRAVESLLEIGVHTLKIEGRQKSASFVHQAVTSLKNWRDSLRQGNPKPNQMSKDLRDLSLIYSRGLGDGFLAGSDHQTLVDGRTPRHRGLRLGRVIKIDRKRVLIDPSEVAPSQGVGALSSPLPAYGGDPHSASGAKIAQVTPVNGMGVVFLQGDEQAKEQGGPIFAVDTEGDYWRLKFGKPGPDLSRVHLGAEVYITSDPRLDLKNVRAAEGRMGVKITVQGVLDQPLRVSAVTSQGFSASTESEVVLQQARKSSLSRAVLEENLGALGGTAFYLSELEVSVPEGLFLPFAELRNIRRFLVDSLTEAVRTGKQREVDSGPHLNKFLKSPKSSKITGSYLVALCRNDDHLEAAIEAGVSEVELDWMELVGLSASVARAREAGLKVGLATVRVQKPGEEAYDRRIEKLQPDSVLLRHWAGVMHFLGRAKRPLLHGDFSLNVTNSITAHHLLGLGLDTLTASHDLDQKQLMALLAAVDPRKLAVTIHHHIPTFHTEHCVYSALLSQGRDFRSCGRPCEEHTVSLKDRVGLEHPVVVDVGCRNTVFNAKAQSAAFLVEDLMKVGVERMRVEFVRESQSEAKDTLLGYQKLLRKEIDYRDLIAEIDVHEQFGVTRGTMEILA